jgi:hypothetical protein
MQGRPRLRERLSVLVPGMSGPGPAATPGRGHAVGHEVHRAIVVVDIAESTAPIRRNCDRVVIRRAMYEALAGAFRRSDWVKCYYEDRGDGVLLLVHPRVPKSWLVTALPEKLEAALAGHNAVVAQQEPIRAAATQVRLRVAINAGEVTFDRHGVVGAAIDYTFRMAEAPPLKDAFANSPDVCGVIVSDWFYDDVVYQHADARPDGYQHIESQVKQTPVSAWMRTPTPMLTRSEPALARAEPTLALRESA